MHAAGELAAWPDARTDRPLKWAEIDAGALAENTARVVAHVGNAISVMAMVKANGYGHGALLAARATLLGGARWLGVSSAEEALQLRDAGIDARILVVGWTHPSTHADLVRAGIDVTVFDAATVESLRASALEAGRTAQAHLKVDTGMNRLGVRREAAVALLRELCSHRDTLELSGVFTHFADADGAARDFTEEQHHRFLEVVAMARELRSGVLVHCANSAATLRFEAMHHDMVRPGLVLYGYTPPHCDGVVEVRPAMTVVASVTHVSTVRRGETVGYNRTWRAPRDTRVAVVAAGYADGVQRAQSNTGCVLIGGRRCRILGLVSMDQMSVDVSGVDGVTAGDDAVIIGGDPGRGVISADAVAAAAGTTSYEVLCAVSARVQRVVTG